ncbi:hypothetical protein [uncultured Ruminococcus sp.]|uniref:hypothetical protein n=1 Tax=uncultured Ruminococcus sp. TaxID=165186 RepID=UPI00292EDD5F|nr:hypothetical protein [uncultured Ruminococcus sp.]
MKKIISSFLIVIILITLCITGVSAAEIGAIPLGICAVVSDIEGNQTIQNSEAITDNENIQGYELFIDRQHVLSVETSSHEIAQTGAVAPTFYQAEFMIPDSTSQVLLTGLKTENVEEIQHRIIENYTAGLPFKITDLSFIDTEKTAQSDGDENLCWAAAASNILHYTGWGAQAGFSDEDELFDLFASSFSDNGSHQENAMAWFFNGAALQRNLFNYATAKIRDYPFSGGYLNDYAYDMVSGYNYIRGVSHWNDIYDLLKQNYGISPGINLVIDNQIVGSHAITLWGLMIDTSLSVDDPDRYQGVLIADSDSDMINERDRRKPDKILEYYPMYVNQRNSFSFDYANGIVAIFDDYEYLMPYSKDVPRETDRSVGRNKTRYPDLIIGEMYLSDKANNQSVNTLFESGKDIYFGYAVSSAADTAWRNTIKTNRKIISSTGKLLYNDTDSISIPFLTGLNYINSTDLSFTSVKNIPAGDYTLTFTVNPQHSTNEAYFYNNSRSIAFQIRDSYIKGDFDNSKKVEIIDATLIQHRLADMIGEDIKADERGDIDDDGLDSTDAVWIMRRLAGFEIPYSIGNKTLHKEI